MAGTIIEVNTELLARDVERLREKLSAMMTETNLLQNDVAALNGMWEGPAKNVFEARTAAERELMLNLAAYIAQMIDEMRLAVTEYNRCETEVELLINSIG